MERDSKGDREEKGSAKRVGTRDGSALRLVSGSVRRTGSSRRVEIKRGERARDGTLPPNRGRTGEEKKRGKMDSAPSIPKVC